MDEWFLAPAQIQVAFLADQAVFGIKMDTNSNILVWRGSGGVLRLMTQSARGIGICSTTMKVSAGLKKICNTDCLSAVF